LELEFDPPFDPSATAAAFASAQPAALSVRSRPIAVVLYDTKAAAVLRELPAVPLTDRVFDLKSRLLPTFPDPGLRHCQLFVMDRVVRLPDSHYLSVYACQETLRLRLAIVPVRICPIHFSDFEAKRRSFPVNLSANPGRTVGFFAAIFSKDPLTVGFECDRQPLLRSTPLISRVWDPALPVCPIFRSLSVTVHFPELRALANSFEVAATTKIRDLERAIRGEFRDVKRFSLSCNGAACRPDSRVTEVNPDLELPFIGRVEELNVFQPPLFRFVLNEFPGSFPLEGANPTMLAVKRVMCTVYSTTPDSIAIFVKGKPAKDNYRVNFAFIHSVQIASLALSIQIHFVPLADHGFKSRIVWNINTNTDRHKSVKDLIDHILQSGQIDPNLKLSLYGGDQQLEPHHPQMHYAQERKLEARYPPPADPTTQRFLRHTEQPRSLSLSISRAQTVREVKQAVMAGSGRPNVLSSVLALQLFDSPLDRDDELFCACGIPENSLIGARLLDLDLCTIRVKWADKVHEFLFSDSDTAAHLKGAVQLMRGADSRPFALFDESRELAAAAPLSPLVDRPIDAVDFVTFRSEAESVSLPVRAGATLADAQSALSSRLGVKPSEIQFVAGISVIADLSRPIFALGDCIQFARVAPRQSFSFEGRVLRLAVDLDAPVSALFALLCAEFDLAAETPLTLITPDRDGVSGSEVDPEMSLTDLALEPDAVLTIARPPCAAIPAGAPQAAPAALPSFLITLILGVIPRGGRFACPPTATLAEVEPVLRERWKLEDLELEFALLDLETGEMAFVSKATPIGTIDHVTFSLSIRPAEIAPADPGVGPADLESAPLGDAAAPDEERLQQSMKMTVGSVSRDLPAYQFVCASNKAEFTLRFPPAATVADARAALALRFGRSPGEVSLVGRGKPLRDQFVMDRLRLGDGKIKVLLSDPGQ
jgi:hypothetical protein